MMDTLDRLLELARAEGAWSAEGLADFAAGLRERARLVLEERVAPLQERIRGWEHSNAALERETAWRRQAMEGLEARIRGLERETAWRRETMASLQDELSGLRGEAQALREARDAAAASHDRLLDHHREVLASAARRFAEAAQLPLWKLRSCRSLLRESAALFGSGTP